MTPHSKARLVLELLDSLSGKWSAVVAGLCLGVASAVAVLHYAPKTYEAKTLIFVAPQQVPQEFVRSTVTDDMSIRLQSLREAVLSRPYLAQLVDEFFGKPANEVELERLISGTRARIEVDLIGVQAAGRERTGGTFRLTYRDQNSERAANVVNALAQLYIEQNVSSRTAQAEGTTKTIEGLADDVARMIEARRREIADFKGHHLYETADQQESNLQQLQGRQQDLNANAIARAAAQDRLTALKAQEAMLDAASDGGTGLAPGADPYTQRLVALERELQSLRNRYTETFPEVIAKKREIEDFKAANAPSTSSPGDRASGQPPMTPLQASIHSAERETKRLEADEATIKRDIAEYKRRLEATPRVEAQLQELTKGYDVLQETYKRRIGNAEEARGAQKIEETQKGERFEVIERATPPAIPIRPIPGMIYAAGVFGGLLLFVGPMVWRAILEPTVRSEAGLLELSDVPVLATIPRLETPEVAADYRRRLVRNVGVSLASVAVLIATAVLLH